MSGELAAAAESTSGMDAPAYPDEYKKRRLSGDERLSRKYVSPFILYFFAIHHQVSIWITKPFLYYYL
jgi:hypothetical protein